MRLPQSLFIAVIILNCLIIAQTNKEYAIQHTGTDKITIDGTLDEPIWQKTIFTDSFVIYTSGAQGNLQIKAKLLWDDQNIYIGFITEDPDIYAQNTEQDSHFYKEDDLVEIFIDPDGNGRDYLEIGISPRETYYDYIIINPDENNWEEDTEWDVKNFVVATTITGTLNNAGDTDSAWTVEMQIPFASLDYPGFGITLPVKTGDSWRANLYRIDYDHTTQEWEPNEEYAWNVIGSSSVYPMGFHSPERFGTVTFSGITAVYPEKTPGYSQEVIKVRQYSPALIGITANFRFTCLTITNTLGQCIYTMPNARTNEISWNTAQVPYGVYYITCYTKGGAVTRQLLHTGVCHP